MNLLLPGLARLPLIIHADAPPPTLMRMRKL